MKFFPLNHCRRQTVNFTLTAQETTRQILRLLGQCSCEPAKQQVRHSELCPRDVDYFSITFCQCGVYAAATERDTIVRDDLPDSYGRMPEQRQFCLGLILGLTIVFVIVGVRVLNIDVTPKHSNQYSRNHEEWDKEVNARGPVRTINFNDTDLHHDDYSEAKRLYDEVRVLVWVMTSPKNLDTKARVVRDTWGRRCNILLFFSSETNTSFPTIGMNVSEGREHLTGKTMHGFKYIYDHHLNDADWFMKVDDDTYVIMENLRYFLSNENTSEPIFFGHHFQKHYKQGYYSGGGGYVVSKEAVRRFGENGGNDPNICRQDGGSEDREFGNCMEKLGVRTSNTTDALGRTRFHCFTPEHHLFGNYPDWYYSYDSNGAKQGPESISDYSITFHYVSPREMQVLEFFIYHLQPYGIVNAFQGLNKLRSKTSSVLEDESHAKA